MTVHVKVSHCVECEGKGYTLTKFNNVGSVPAVNSCSYCGGTGHLVEVTEE